MAVKKYEQLAQKTVRVVENNTNALKEFSASQKEMSQNVNSTMNIIHQSLTTVISTMQEREKLRMEAEASRESDGKTREKNYQKYIVWLVIIAILLAGGATVFQIAAILSKST